MTASNALDRFVERASELYSLPAVAVRVLDLTAAPHVDLRALKACIENDPAQTLFISGTASIVGHERAHAGDVRAQTIETLRNVRAVLAAANARVGAQRYALEQLSYKVYVRRPDDLATIQAELRAAIGPAAPMLYLNADICRRELLVELEAVGT